MVGATRGFLLHFAPLWTVCLERRPLTFSLSQNNHKVRAVVRQGSPYISLVGVCFNNRRGRGRGPGGRVRGFSCEAVYIPFAVGKLTVPTVKSRGSDRMIFSYSGIPVPGGQSGFICMHRSAIESEGG